MSPDAVSKAPPATTASFRRTCPRCEGDGLSASDRKGGHWHPNSPFFNGCDLCEGDHTVGVECLTCGGEVAENGACDCGARHCVDCARDGLIVVPASPVTGLCDECAQEVM